MRKYEDNEERTIRAERLVREWNRSGLLDKAQSDRIAQELKVDLRRTNFFLRLVLFGFGILIIAASCLLAGVMLSVRQDSAVAAICFSAAAGSLLLAEFLTSKFNLYRFGIEEAAAIAMAVLLAVSTVFAVGSFMPDKFDGAAALIVASAGATFIYLRFGYVYAAAAAMLCVSAAPFQLKMPETNQRLIAAGLLTAIFLVARSRRLEHGEEFPGDEYGAIQAIASAGIYAVLNLQLFSFTWIYHLAISRGPFYWFTYAMIWILPAITFYLAVRAKDRALLDVGLVLALATLATNKPYLGVARQTWDPILLGVLLIGTAVGLRRWLARGDNRVRYGFTAERILASDKSLVSIAGTASTAIQGLHHAAPATPSPDKFEAGGGRSGGAGASGSF